MPGSIVPCASKNITAFGERRIYCGFGLGIAENRSIDANLFMEDVGEIPINISKEDVDRYKNKIIENISKSVLCIGENQRIKFKEIFVDIKDLYISKDEVGCALVAAPYFTLAREAIPKKVTLNKFAKMSLDEWQNYF